MTMSPRNRKRRRSETGMGQAVVPRMAGAGSYSTTAADQGAQRVSAAVVLVFIVASTLISLYDLHLIVTLLAR